MSNDIPPEINQLISSPLANGPLAPTGASLVLVEWTDSGGGFTPPHTMAPRHVHHEDDEAFYVLEGTLAFELNGETVEASAGDAVMIPKGTSHTWWNPRENPCRYLILMPRRVHDLITAIHTVDRETTSLAGLFRHYQSEIVQD